MKPNHSLWLRNILKYELNEPGNFIAFKQTQVIDLTVHNFMSVRFSYNSQNFSAILSSQK